MPPQKINGTWPYRGFTVRYHRLSAPDTATLDSDAPWWAEILEAPAISPPLTATYAAARDAAERAIDALLASGHPAPPEPVVSRGHFQHLVNFLASRPLTDTMIVLSFADLEALLGEPLSRSARTKGWYWLNPTFPHVRRWLTQGWAARPQITEQVIVFSRTGDDRAEA